MLYIHELRSIRSVGIRKEGILERSSCGERELDYVQMRVSECMPT